MIRLLPALLLALAPAAASARRRRSASRSVAASAFTARAAIMTPTAAKTTAEPRVKYGRRAASIAPAAKSSVTAGTIA